MELDEAIERMQKIALEDDQEEAHIAADNLLCEVLKSLGYEALVEAYNKVSKWYA